MSAGSTRENKDHPGFPIYQVVSVPPTRRDRPEQPSCEPCIQPVEQAVEKLHALDSIGMT
jgi:hypothetical protein